MIIARREGFVLVDDLRVEATPTGRHRKYFQYRLLKGRCEILRGMGRPIRRALLEYFEGK